MPANWLADSMRTRRLGGRELKLRLHRRVRCAVEQHGDGATGEPGGAFFDPARRYGCSILRFFPARMGLPQF